MPTPDLIGSAEVCRILAIDRATLSRWVHHSKPKLTPAMRLSEPRGAMLFRREDVDAVLASADGDVA